MMCNKDPVTSTLHRIRLEIHTSLYFFNFWFCLWVGTDKNLMIPIPLLIFADQFDSLSVFLWILIG